MLKATGVRLRSLLFFAVVAATAGGPLAAEKPQPGIAGAEGETRASVAFEDRVDAVAFGLNGRLLVSGGADAAVKLWDVTNGKLLRILGRHGGPVSSVAVSPNGRFVVSGSLATSVKLWDSQSGRLVRTFPSQTTAEVCLDDRRFVALWLAIESRHPQKRICDPRRCCRLAVGRQQRLSQPDRGLHLENLG
ncbi:MAG: WD40 repeat domain-containing protein [Roseiarcus sp.]